MASEILLRERARRSEWVARFNAVLRNYPSTEGHQVIWTEVQRSYFDGESPEQAAVKYMDAHHIGVNSEP